jgi:hypothetical protein
MKTLKTESEITSKNLKNQDCEFKGRKLGFDKDDKVYFSGSLFHTWRDEFETIEDLKLTF